MSRPVTILKNSTADDAVKLVIETAWQCRNSKAVNKLLAAIPYQPRLSWFEQMFWHIDGLTAYDYDKPGREQIKTPDRFLADRIGDCDDYSTLWLAILYRLGVKAWPKIVNYQADKFWDHIYVIVPMRKPVNGKDYLVLDNVYGKFRFLFNREVTYMDQKVFKDKTRSFYGINFN